MADNPGPIEAFGRGVLGGLGLGGQVSESDRELIRRIFTPTELSNPPSGSRPISFASLPFGASVGPSGGSGVDLLSRMVQAGSGPLRAGRADTFQSFLVPDERSEDEIARDVLLREAEPPSFFRQAVGLEPRRLEPGAARPIPGEPLAVRLRKQLALEVAKLKINRAEHEAAEARKKKTRAENRQFEIARLMARARLDAPESRVPDAEAPALSKFIEARDARQEAGKRLESLSLLERAEAIQAEGGPPVADPFRRELEEGLLAEVRERVVDPKKVSLGDAKELLVGARLLDEQKRAGGDFNAKKVAKDFRRFLEGADEPTIRSMLGNELGRAVAEKESLPGPILDALLVSPLGERKVRMFARGAADAATFGLSELGVTQVLGEAGLADQLAVGEPGDVAASMLGYLAGAGLSFNSISRAAAKAGFSPRTLHQRLAFETAVFDVSRVPGIVLNGRAQGLSDADISKQVAFEVGFGVLTGATLGMGGAAASFGKRELSAMTARAGRGLGRIVREFPEKLPQALDLLETFGDMLTSAVQGVSGGTPRAGIRGLPELRRIVQSAADDAGLSATQLGNIVKLVAPKRGATGSLESLSSREIREVMERIVTPVPTVPRGTRLKSEDHMFFAVPRREADNLRRGGVVPEGTKFHGTPAAAIRNIQGRAEVFAIPVSTVKARQAGATSGAAVDPIELPALSKTMQGGETGISLSKQIKGFKEQTEQFGVSPLQMLAAEPVPLSMDFAAEGRGRVGRAVAGAGKLAGKVPLPLTLMRSKLYAEAFYGISRNMIEAMAPKAGRLFTQRMDQLQDVAALKGEFLRRAEDIMNTLRPKEIVDLRLMKGGRKPPPDPGDMSPLVKAYRDAIQHDNEIMDIMEAINPDGSRVTKVDGSPFRRLSNHMEQPLRDEIVEAVETASSAVLKLGPDGNFRFSRDPGIGGRKLRQQQKRLDLYNRFIDATAKQMRSKGMRYNRNLPDNRQFLVGQTSNVSIAELKAQARAFFQDHRNVVMASQYYRPGVPTSQELMEGFRPRRFGAVDFARRFEYDLEFIRPDMGDNWIRHIHQLFDRRAESIVFGENLERLGEILGKKMPDGTMGPGLFKEVNDRLGSHMAEWAVESVTKLYARDTNNLAILGAKGALAEQGGRLPQLLRNLTGAYYLGPGSTFQLGGNGIWAVFGAASQLPIKATIKNFGFDSLAASGLGAFLGNEMGKALGDTPEEQKLNARRLMVLGASAGFGATLARDTTVRALVPVAVPTAAALAGFFGPGTDADPIHRKLLAAGAFLAGASAARSRTLRRFAASPTAVRAAKDAGAINVHGIVHAQPDLVTNSLAPAFFADKAGRVGRFARDTFFGITQGWEIWARSSSARASAAAASGMIDELAKSPALWNKSEGRFFLRQLRRMGLTRRTVEDIIRKNDGILPDALMDRVMRRGVENTQYVLRAMDLPLMWSSPWGRVFTQFMGMGLRQFQNTTRFALQEAGLGNWWPMIKIGPLAVVSGVSVQGLRDLVNGRDLEPLDFNKFTRAVQILGPSMGLFGDAARGIARITEGGNPGEALLDVLSPAAVDATRDVVNGLFDAWKAVVSNDPDIRRGRTVGERALRAAPGVKTLDTLAERDFPDDDDVIRQFQAQMPRRLQQIEAAKQGKSLGQFLQELPNTPPGSPFFELRKMAERAAPVAEDVARTVADGIGFLPVAPSKRIAEEQAQATEERLKTAPGVLERGAAMRSRIRGKQVTKEGFFDELRRRAGSDARKGIVDRIVSGIRENDTTVKADNIDRFMRMGGKASSLISALRTRATNQRDESLSASIPEAIIHRAEARQLSRRDILIEIGKTRNPVRQQAFIQILRERRP